MVGAVKYVNHEINYRFFKLQHIKNKQLKDKLLCSLIFSKPFREKTTSLLEYIHTYKGDFLFEPARPVGYPRGDVFLDGNQPDSRAKMAQMKKII